MCSIPGCERVVCAKGLCRPCWQKKRRQERTPEQREADAAKDRAYRLEKDYARVRRERYTDPEVAQASRARTNSANNRRWRDNPEWREKRLQQRRERDKDPVWHEKKLAKDREYYERTSKLPEVKKKRSQYSRLRNTGTSPELFEALWTMQAGQCAICSRAMSEESHRADSVNADHCHEAKEPRGLLCSICNQALGMYEKHQRQQGIVIEAYDAYLNETPVKKLLASSCGTR